MHRFLIAAGSQIGDTIMLDRDESKHLSKVLRLSTGDEIQLSDGTGNVFSGTITDISNDGAHVKLCEALPSHESSARITVYQGYPKSDKLELICQKLTELGADTLVPVEMRYSVAKPKPGKDVRLVRIADEAMKQCGRGARLNVTEAVPFQDALESMKKHDLLLMPWEEEHTVSLTKVLMRYTAPISVGIIIGPEGGISIEEAEMAKSIGAIAVSLGERIPAFRHSPPRLQYIPLSWSV